MTRVTVKSFDPERWARYHAEQHVKYDPYVVRIFHLPVNAPEFEVRLLDVNVEVCEMIWLRPFDDHGKTEEGVHYITKVLDVTPSQWDEIQEGRLSLPEGWMLEGRQELYNKYDK